MGRVRTKTVKKASK
nr:unnamed protein product [Callosobruchus analis]